MSTVADYVGRTVDLLAYTGQDPTKEVLLLPVLARTGKGGEICAGAQKLGQRWLLEFLTIRGTMQFMPTRGCEFVGQLARGEMRTTLDAEQAFYLSAAQVADNLSNEESGNIPDDEAYAGIELLAMTVSGDTLVMRVKLSSKAGESRVVLLPISVTLGK